MFSYSVNLKEFLVTNMKILEAWSQQILRAKLNINFISISSSEDSESASEDEMVSPSRPLSSSPSLRLEKARPSLSLPSFWRRYGN